MTYNRVDADVKPCSLTHSLDHSVTHSNLVVCTIAIENYNGIMVVMPVAYMYLDLSTLLMYRHSIVVKSVE